MAEPQNKELQAEIKRTNEEMRLFQTEILERMERLEAGNTSKFNDIHAALDILIQQTPSKHRHGAELNNRPPFQPKEKEILEAEYESAKQREGPQNTHGKEVANNNAEISDIRTGARPRKPHSMWRDYVKE
ncbi:unnamed protein product [Vicia faba]|uniref:Uncharacterized protein n=1 Tax=Vicia faba TaxID=3906 RepID=A0AAV0YH90_VICFA|nr:unnamed protein product [Vicia faba]